MKKIAPWAKSHLVLLKCVQATNRFAANEQLLGTQPSEILLFENDRYMQHLATVLQNGPTRIPVRTYFSL